MTPSASVPPLPLQATIVAFFAMVIGGPAYLAWLYAPAPWRWLAVAAGALLEMQMIAWCVAKMSGAGLADPRGPAWVVSLLGTLGTASLVLLSQLGMSSPARRTIWDRNAGSPDVFVVCLILWLSCCAGLYLRRKLVARER